MKNTILSVVYLLVILFFLCGFNWNSDKKANKLYVEASLEASHFLNSTEKWTDSYSALWDSYTSVKEKIESILSEYPSSDIAVGLLSGELEISGLTLKQFKEKESIVKLLHEAENSPILCALIVAQTIKAPLPRSKSLASIAMTYFDIDQKQIDKTVKLLSQSNESVKTIKDKLKKVWAFINLARLYQKIGQTEQIEPLLLQALKTYEAHTLATKEDIFSLNPLVYIAYGYQEVGQLDQAIKIANKIKIDGVNHTKEAVLGNIAVECAKKDQFDRAIKIAEKFSNSKKKTKTLIRIAIKYAEKEELDKAHQLLNQALGIKNDNLTWDFLGEDIIKTLVTIAKKGAEANNPELALTFLSSSVEWVNGIEIASYKCSPLIIIASEYVEMGETEKAKPLLSQAIKISTSLDGLSEYQKIETLTKIANKFLKLVQFNKIIELINTIKIDENNINSLTDTVNKYFDAGENEKALKLISIIVEKINTMEPTEKDKAKALINMADMYNHIGQKKQMRQQLDKALEATKTIDESEFWDTKYLRSSVSVDIANKYFDIGGNERAKKILNKAFENVDQIANQEYKIILLTEIFDIYIKIGEKKLAKHILSQLLEKISKMQNLEEKSRKLTWAHRYYTQCGCFPGEKDKSLLRDIISEANPMSQLLNNTD
jgi:tetratricopeptide (TPR) repeat protein